MKLSEKDKFELALTLATLLMWGLIILYGGAILGFGGSVP